MEERKPVASRTVYTRLKDVTSENQRKPTRMVAVNIIAAVDTASFRPYNGQDEVIGEVTVGDSSASAVLIVTRKYRDILEGPTRVFSIKNVLTNVAHGRLQLELNEFTQIAPVTASFSINKSCDISSFSFDPYS